MHYCGTAVVAIKGNAALKATTLSAYHTKKLHDVTSDM